MAMAYSLFCCGIPVHAEASGKTDVTYTNTGGENEKTAYPLSVEAKGTGGVSTGKDSFRNQTQKYLLIVGESMTFELTPDSGAEVKSVTLNGTDVLSQVKGNKITITGLEKEQKLSVTFAAKAGSQNTSNKGSTTTTVTKIIKQGPKTGDSTNAGIMILLLILCLLYMGRKISNYLRIGGEKRENGKE